MKIRRSFGIASLVVLMITIQFIRPAQNHTSEISKNGLESLYEIPDSIQYILRTACYDCHSNNTYYPWYSKVQPLGWLLHHHIVKGKSELNFDEIATYSARRRASKFKAIVNQVKEDKMPIRAYTWLHSDARLSDGQKQMLVNWFSK